MKKLFLKKEPDYLTMLTPSMKKDTGRIINILNSRGYEAAEATVVKAWEKVSDDTLCISWLPIDATSDDIIFTAIMRYLETNE